MQKSSSFFEGILMRFWKGWEAKIHQKVMPKSMQKMIKFLVGFLMAFWSAFGRLSTLRGTPPQHLFDVDLLWNDFEICFLNIGLAKCAARKTATVPNLRLEIEESCFENQLNSVQNWMKNR